MTKGSRRKGTSRKEKATGNHSVSQALFFWRLLTFVRGPMTSQKRDELRTIVLSLGIAAGLTVFGMLIAVALWLV
jgi:hypothetical protein